jgi:hypothetical protein
MPTLETTVTAINAFAASIVCAISAGPNFISSSKTCLQFKKLALGGAAKCDSDQHANTM